MVSAELQAKKLLSEHGSLSDKGREKLNEVEGIIVNSGKRKIGYVFKFLNQDKLYPYFIQKVEPADILKDKGQHPKIVTGTKGDGEDYTELPFFIDDLVIKKQTFNKPTEREVLQLIQNTYIKGEPKQEDEEKNNKLSKQLSIRFLKDQPEIVWVCTYIYLKENEEGYFNPEWRIADPFGFGDSISLKFYLSKLGNENLNKSIIGRFSDAKTLEGKTLSDFYEIINKRIEEKLLSDFSIGIITVDTNLQMYIESVIKNIILLEQQNYNDFDASLSFSLNIQNALENIFKQDREQRNSIYEIVYSELDKDFEKKKRSLTGIYRQKLFSSSTLVPQPIINVCKGSLARGNSLLSYVASFILTYNYDNKSILFKLLKNRIDQIIEIAQLRNEKGHGQTASEKELRPLSEAETLNHYNFFKSFINDYLNYK
jgi:DNA-binding protein Fis